MNYPSTLFLVCMQKPRVFDDVTGFVFQFFSQCSVSYEIMQKSVKQNV